MKHKAVYFLAYAGVWRALDEAATLGWSNILVVIAICELGVGVARAGSQGGSLNANFPVPGEIRQMRSRHSRPSTAERVLEADKTEMLHSLVVSRSAKTTPAAGLFPWTMPTFFSPSSDLRNAGDGEKPVRPSHGDTGRLILVRMIMSDEKCYVFPRQENSCGQSRCSERSKGRMTLSDQMKSKHAMPSRRSSLSVLMSRW